VSVSAEVKADGGTVREKPLVVSVPPAVPIIAETGAGSAEVVSDPTGSSFLQPMRTTVQRRTRTIVGFIRTFLSGEIEETLFANVERAGKNGTPSPIEIRDPPAA
jgi:hypothetical protein